MVGNLVSIFFVSFFFHCAFIKILINVIPNHSVETGIWLGGITVLCSEAAADLNIKFYFGISTTKILVKCVRCQANSQKYHVG